MSRSFAFVFACTPGDSEIKSALLASSLARSLRCDHELIALIPESAEKWGRHKPATLALLRRLGVRLVGATLWGGLDDPIDFDIECLRVQTDCEKLVLLETDRLLLRELADEPRFSVPFSACAAFAPPGSVNESTWRAMFQTCGAHLPPARFYSPYTGQYFPLCFDGGLVVVPARSRFGDAWLECFQNIRRSHPAGQTRDLQNIALAIAAVKLGMEIDVLEQRYNHPAGLRPLNDAEPPIFARYEDPKIIAREPALLVHLNDLLREHADLRALLADDPAWNSVANIASDAGAKIKTGEPLAPELIITGIPRSGTSYLCNILHQMSNCVILNEPVETVDILKSSSSPFGVANFARDRRRDVLGGVPIPNKLTDGQITQDTAKFNETRLYSPRVESANFVLGIKHTLAFLSRLPFLYKTMPGARFVACVRDPFDTIASWKGSFPHLNIADVVRHPVGNPLDPWLTTRQSQELQAIAGIADPASRRAAWWRHLANLILDSRDRLILIRYKDLVTHPQQTVSKILDGWPAGVPTQPIQPSTVRRRPDLLDQYDQLAIRALCREPARALGLDCDR
ncbi:MAG TPA: sulfotransferase [Tepidisphaeraceae bacterium]|nr:sulfotransferase [Tepidisphaeraceae bacterium]